MFTTHTVVDAQGETYNTATALFPDVHGCEWYHARLRGDRPAAGQRRSLLP
jgi:hypothetical protein